MGWKAVVNIATSGLAIVGGAVGTILTGGSPTHLFYLTFDFEKMGI